MRHKYFYLLLIPMAAFVIVVGYGYWKQHKPVTAKKSSTPRTTVTGEMPFLPPEDGLTVDSEQIKRQSLDTAIRNFRQATAFRANVTKNASTGAITGKIEYMRPLRLHAQITASNQQMDMIAIGQTVYLKKDNVVWGMVPDPSAKLFAADFFASVLKSEPTLASFDVPADAPMKIDNDAVKKCTRYSTKYTSDKDLLDISFCVNSDNQIVYIKMKTPDGDLSTDYYDFNTLLIIERPMLPLLERRIEVTGMATGAR